MTDEKIQELRDLHSKTTEGCWAVVTHNETISTLLALVLSEKDPPEIERVVGAVPKSDADMLFIAAAHTEMIALLDELQRLRAQPVCDCPVEFEPEYGEAEYDSEFGENDDG